MDSVVNDEAFDTLLDKIESQAARVSFLEAAVTAYAIEKHPLGNITEGAMFWWVDCGCGELGPCNSREEAESAHASHVALEVAKALGAPEGER